MSDWLTQRHFRHSTRTWITSSQFSVWVAAVPLPASMLAAELNWTEKGTNQFLKWFRSLRSLKRFIRLNDTFVTDTTLVLSPLLQIMGVMSSESCHRRLIVFLKVTDRVTATSNGFPAHLVLMKPWKCCLSFSYMMSIWLSTGRYQVNFCWEVCVAVAIGETPNPNAAAMPDAHMRSTSHASSVNSLTS